MGGLKTMDESRYFLAHDCVPGKPSLGPSDSLLSSPVQQTAALFPRVTQLVSTCYLFLC